MTRLLYSVSKVYNVQFVVMFCSTSRASRSSRTAESPLSQGYERQRCRRACRLNNYLTSRFFVCIQQCQEIATLNERSPQHIIQEPGQVASKQMPVDVLFTCVDRQGWRKSCLLCPRSLQFIAQIRPECSLFAPKCCLLAPGFLPEIVIIAAAEFRGKSPF